VFVQLQEALAEASPTEPPWLPAPAAAALGHMLHSSVLRAGGRTAEAAMQLGQAEELIESALAVAKVSWTSCENDIAPGILARASVYLHMRAIAGEHRTLAALLSSDYVSASKHALQLALALQRFPRSLHLRSQSVAMLLGHYAHSTGDHEMAIALFETVLHSDSAVNMHRLAAISASLSELQHGDGEEAIGAALKHLEGQGIVDVSALQALPTHERYSSLY